MEERRNLYSYPTLGFALREGLDTATVNRPYLAVKKIWRNFEKPRLKILAYKYFGKAITKILQ